MGKHYKVALPASYVNRTRCGTATQRGQNFSGLRKSQIGGRRWELSRKVILGLEYIIRYDIPKCGRALGLFRCGMVGTRTRNDTMWNRALHPQPSHQGCLTQSADRNTTLLYIG